MKRIFRPLLTILILCLVNPASPDSRAKILAPEALKLLLEGNKRFEIGEPEAPRRDYNRRAEVALGQNPFAVVVTCSDSRVTPEFIFDQGLGDLFVVRVAGNTLAAPEIGSIEYAVEHLGARLIVVMGHEKCGAVKAALGGGHLEGNLEAVVAPIKPAVNSVKNKSGDQLALACEQNVQNMLAVLDTKSHLIHSMSKKGFVNKIGMVYHLESGKVNLLPASNGHN